MAVISMRQLLEAGVHFGHQTRRWNPKMRRFIFGERNGIYIIDLEQTLSRVETAYGFVRDLVAEGGEVLFVGTKKQAQDPIQSYAEKVGMPYVNHRWLGGMLTNFDTIGKRVAKMLDYERMKTSGEFDVMIKKEALMLDRELAKLQRNLGGLRDMKRLPKAVFVVDTKKEHIAVTEANKLGIPVVAIVDTNVDPDVIQYPIPGNDDAIRANGLLVKVIAEAVEEGRFIRSRRPKADVEIEAEAKPDRTPEEEAAFAQAQAEARAAAARAQADREARLAASKSAGNAEAAEDAAVSNEVAAEVGASDSSETDVAKAAGEAASAAGAEAKADSALVEIAHDEADVAAETTIKSFAKVNKPAADTAGDAPSKTEKADADKADADKADADKADAAAEKAAGADAAGADGGEGPHGPGSHAPLEDGSQPEGYPIKGNADSMLYHTPESPFYGRTKAEVWFADEQSAEHAGFSKPASQQ